MGTYSLNWPGFGDFPIYVIDKENGTIYSEKDPLPYERRNLNHFGHHHVLLDDVMELFSSMTMVKASIKLVLLTDNVTMYPIYKDEKTKKRYLSLDTLLAFIIVYPFCPEFQRARAAVLRFLTLYPDLTCSSCGFIERDCRCVRIAKKPLSKLHPFDTLPEELVAKVTDLSESSTQTDKKICPICEDADAFQTATSPWLVMPPGMKVRPGDKLPLPVLNNAKIINCAMIDDGESANSMGKSNLQPEFNFPPHPSMHSAEISPMPGLPMQMVTQAQLAGLPLSVLPYNFTSERSYFGGPHIPNVVPQNPVNPMMSIAQQFSALPGTSYLQPLNLTGSFFNTSFGGPPAPGNMSPLAPLNNNGASVPGSMGPPLAPPPPRSLMKSQSPGQISPIENIRQLTSHFKPSKIKTILAKRKIIGEEVRRGRPPKKPKNNSNDFKMIGPARRISDNGEVKEDGSTDADMEISGSPGKKVQDSDLEPGEVPKEVLEEIKDSVVIEYGDGKQKTDDGLSSGSGEATNAEKKDESSTQVPDNAEPGTSKTSDEHATEEMSSEAPDNVPQTKKEDAETKDDSAVNDSSVDQESEKANLLNKADTSNNGHVSSEVINENNAEGDNISTTPSKDSSSSVEDTNDKDSKEDGASAKEKDNTSETAATEMKEADSTSDQPNKEKPLKIQSASGVLLPAEKCKDSPYYMVSPNGNVTLHERGFAEFEFGPTGEKMLRCILYGCGQCFDTFELAELHEKTHCARGQGLECPHCDSYKVVNTRWYHLLRHMDTVHGVKMGKSDYQCNLCGLDLENEEAFQDHQTFHHYSHYKCIHCGITLFTWNHVKHHLKECADKEKGHFYHNCPYCHIVFHGPAFQDVHVKSHNDQGLVCCFCKEEKVWDSWKHLKKHYEIFHLAKEHKRLHKCMHCKMHFSSLKKFKVHLQNRHNPEKEAEPKVPVKRKRKSSKVDDEKQGEQDGDGKTEKTVVVGKKTGRIRKKKSIDTSEWVGGDEVLSEEEANEGSDDEQGEDKKDKKDTSVSNEKEAENDEQKVKEEENDEPEEEKEEEVVMLECPECDKKFRTQKRLDMHVERTHGEEVQCSKCNYVARNAYHMKAHEQQKHGEKEHQCSDCGKPFSRYFELKIHLAKHARNTVYTCKTCWQEFESRVQLRNHKESAHAVEVKPKPSRQESKEREDLSCKLCDHTADSRASLQTHLLSEHPEDGVDHAYFNKTSKSSAKTSNSSKPVKAVTGRGGRGKKLVKAGKGRGRGKVSARGGPAAVVGNTGRRGRKDKAKERKIKEKLVKDRMLRKLKRSTCARTRSIDEHRAIKKQESEENMTIDETTMRPPPPTRPSPAKGRWAKTYPPVVSPARPTSSLWSDFEITHLEPSSEDIAKVRSVELDHSYYHSTSQDILTIRNQLRDTRASVSEDDTWAPEPTGYEECLTSPSGQRHKGKQQTPPQLKTVLRGGPGQLQSMHGSHRVELQQPSTSSSLESAEDLDIGSSSQNDSLGDLEKFIQGDMSDIMLAAEQYLQESSLMNDTLEGISSPNTSSDFFLQDAEPVVSNVDLPSTSLQSSPVKRAVSLQSFRKGSPSSLKNSPRKKVVVQSANRQIFTLPKLNANSPGTDDLLKPSSYLNNTEGPNESHESDIINEEVLSDGLSLNISAGTNSTSVQLDYLQPSSDIGSLPDDILQSPEYNSSANDSQLNSSADGPEFEVEQSCTSTPKNVNVEFAATSSSQKVAESRSGSSSKNGATVVQYHASSESFQSPSIETIERTPTTTVVKLTNNPVQIQQSQPRTILMPTKRTVVPQTKVNSVRSNEQKKTVLIQSTVSSSGKRTVILPSPTEPKEQKIVLRSPGAVGNMMSVFQDVKGLSGVAPGVAPGSKVKVIRVIQTPGPKTSTSTGPTQRILIPKSNAFTKTVQRPSTSTASNIVSGKPESEVEEAVRSISQERSMVEELNDALFSNVTDGAE